MATHAAGTVTSYALTTGVKINMDELIYLISPTDLPLTLGVDSAGSMIVRTQPVDQIQFYWQDEELLTPRVAITVNAVTADTTFTVASGEALRFATGDVARVMRAAGATTEMIRITGVSNATITATRAYASTTATTFATGDFIIGTGAGLAEGSDPEAFRSRDRDSRSNYTQIFGPYKISMTRTEQKISKYGVSDEWSKQLWNRSREYWMRIEQALLYGKALNDSSGKIRMTGGLTDYITTNVNSTSTQLTVANIVSLQQTAYNLGDVPLILIANPNSLGDLNDIANTSQIRVTEQDSRRGRARVEYIDTEFGSTVLVRDRWCFPATAFLVKPDGIIRRVLDPMMYEGLAKTGDADNAMIVGEEGFEIKGQQHMARFSALTYTAA